jgi:hypothetical protein
MTELPDQTPEIPEPKDVSNHDKKELGLDPIISKDQSKPPGYDVWLNPAWKGPTAYSTSSREKNK